MRCFELGQLAESGLVHGGLNFGVGRFTFIRPALTMRARGALAAEHILMARPTSPARMHFCIVARNTSLLIDALYTKIARSTMMPMARIWNSRMGYMPQPPSWK